MPTSITVVFAQTSFSKSTCPKQTPKTTVKVFSRKQGKKIFSEGIKEVDEMYGVFLLSIHLLLITEHLLL